MSVISSLSKRGQLSTVSKMSEVPPTEGLMLYLDSSDEASYDGGPTTNYFVPTEGTFPVNGTGTFQRIRSGSYGGYTIRPTDVVYRYELGTLGCHYHGVDVAVPSVFPTGSTVQFSFDYLISAGTTIETDYIANFEQCAAGAITNGGQSLGVWRSVVLTSTVSLAGYPYVRAFLYPGACGSVRLAADGFILYKNPQLEMLNYASRFVYGPNSTNNVRSNGNIWRDLSGRGNDFTIQGNITWDKDTGFSNFDGNSVTNGNKIYRNNFPQNLKTNQNGQGYTVVVVARSTTVGAWRKLIGNYDGENYLDLYQNPSGYFVQDGSGDILYVDGVQVSSGTYYMYNAGYHCYAATNTNNGLATNPTYALSIGNEPINNNYPWIGNIAVVLMYERVLTASEIKQISNLYKDKYNY